MRKKIAMSKWVKVVDVGDEQVLFYVERDRQAANNNVYCMHQMVLCPDGDPADFMIAGIKEDQIELILDQINEETAREVHAVLTSLTESGTQEDAL